MRYSEFGCTSEWQIASAGTAHYSPAPETGPACIGQRSNYNTDEEAGARV